MENHAPYVITLLAIYLVAAIVLIVLTAKSPMSKEKKTVSYIVIVLAGPIIGLVTFLIFRNKTTNGIAR